MFSEVIRYEQDYAANNLLNKCEIPELQQFPLFFTYTIDIFTLKMVSLTTGPSWTFPI